jgi:hypothetical protein
MHYALSWWVAAQEGRGAQGELHSAAQAHADRRGWLAAWWGGFDADRGAGPDGANRRLAHWAWPTKTRRWIHWETRSPTKTDPTGAIN